ncbi:alkaline phosphatase synthesis transcriptional regulatory protein PhoP [Lachnospiraceae bacterium]|nr:alkaline phosphatase synthesis transcriptional regulatory protein PhoP [Lachnospiraceae bacterium]
MSEKILVVDDEKEITDLISLYLQNENYTVYPFYDSLKACGLAENTELDLAILDVMMPKMDGFTLCQKIREKYNYPIIMLTAKEEEVDKITGLTLGADDYMTKPFRPLELIARVKAQLRRYKKYNQQSPAEDSHMISHGGLILNSLTHECTLDEKPLNLTPTEFTILYVLCQKKGQVISAEDLFHAVWGEEYFSKSNNTITVHIRHLREKMNDSFEDPKYIKTVWGCGYKIEG